MTREIQFYEKHFVNFYLSLDSNAQEKIEYVFQVIRTVDRIPQKFLNHIEGTNGLYEIRIKVVVIFTEFFVALTKDGL
ncbi:hypothetical protein [Flammeovirga sp. MY04]|uniref:hypothetical protein n=1 Tax=Flammeovirga sp. MY04 TaxID=1191459 RepID=UPI0008061E03|nr:hypothetical protein [Flammeovirga sp. MY04]